MRQRLRFFLPSRFTRVNGDNSNASTNARWKVVNCHVGIHIDQVHFCISVPVFALDMGTCLFRGVSTVFGKRKSRLRAIASRNEPWERLTQRTLGRVSDFPMIPSAEPIINCKSNNSLIFFKTNIKCFQASCGKCNFYPQHKIKKFIIIIIYLFI